MATSETKTQHPRHNLPQAPQLSTVIRSKIQRFYGRRSWIKWCKKMHSQGGGRYWLVICGLDSILMVRIIHVNVQMTCKVRLYLVWYLLFILVWYKKWEKFAWDLEKCIHWRDGIRWNPTRQYAYVHITSYCSGTHVYTDFTWEEILYAISINVYFEHAIG